MLELDAGAPFEPRRQPPGCRSRSLVAAAGAGSTVVAVVDTKPPLVVSHDAGRTWRESGRGLPAGRAVADLGRRPRPRPVRDAQPPLPLPRRRPLLARPGGRAAGDRGRSLRPGLRLSRAGTRRARRRPPSRRPRLRSTRSALPSTRAYSVDGRPISTPCVISISSPKAIRPCRARWSASGPAAEPVAGSSATPPPGANIRVFHRVPEPAMRLIAEHLAELGEPRRDRAAAPATSASRAERDEHVAEAVVVDLDRQLRALDAERREAAPPRPRTARSVGIGCSIRPKTIRAPSRSSSDRARRPLPVSSRISPSWSGPARTNAEPSVGMPGERHLDARREDPDLRVGVLGRRRVDEDRLREVHLAREPLERLLGELARVGEDGELVARERRVGEDVADDVAEGRHRAESRPARTAVPT